MTYAVACFFIPQKLSSNSTNCYPNIPIHFFVNSVNIFYLLFFSFAFLLFCSFSFFFVSDIFMCSKHLLMSFESVFGSIPLEQLPKKVDIHTFQTFFHVSCTPASVHTLFIAAANSEGNSPNMHFEIGIKYIIHIWVWWR